MALTNPSCMVCQSTLVVDLSLSVILCESPFAGSMSWTREGLDSLSLKFRGRSTSRSGSRLTDAVCERTRSVRRSARPVVARLAREPCALRFRDPEIAPDLEFVGDGHDSANGRV